MLPSGCVARSCVSQDRGGEYRSLLGVPGGLSGPMADPIKEEAAKRGLTLREGSGGDPDTLMRNTVSKGKVVRLLKCCLVSALFLGRASFSLYDLMSGDGVVRGKPGWNNNQYTAQELEIVAVR